MLPAKNYITPEEYLRMEENSLEKHEYFEGEVFMMSGGTINHNLICSNIVGELRALLRKKPCMVFGSDMRIRVEAGHDGFYSYPDAMIICGKPQSPLNRKDEVTNPVLIAEVLSRATAKYDRSEKFEMYRELESLSYYLTIDQSRVYVEYHEKTAPDTWVMKVFTSVEQVINIPSLEIELAVAALYEKVEFE